MRKRALMIITLLFVLLLDLKANTSKGISIDFQWSPKRTAEAAICTDGSNIYTAVWTTTPATAPHAGKFYKYSMEGALVDSFKIPTGATTFIRGIRSLTYDGTYFYGGMTTNAIYKMDFTNKVILDTIDLPVAIKARFVTYDSAADAFWVGDYAAGARDFTLVNRNGNLSSASPNVVSASAHGLLGVYGLAYDGWSAGGPYLWAYDGNGLTKNDLIQVRIADGAKTFMRDIAPDISATASFPAGGAFAYHNNVTGKNIIAGLSQNKKVFGYDIGSITSEADFTVTPKSNAFGLVYLGQSSAYKKITVINYGSGTPLVINSRNDITLSSGDVGEFSLMDSLTFPVTIQLGQKVSFYACFTPTEAVAKNAKVSITTSGDKGIHTDCVTLMGTGTVPYSTTGAPAGIAFLEGFENGSPGWQNFWLIGAGAGYNGTTGLALMGGAKNVNLTSPRMIITGYDSISYMIKKAATTTNDSIYINYTESLNPADPAAVWTFLPGSKLIFRDTPLDWGKIKVALTGLTGKTVAIRLVGAATGGVVALFLDNVCFFNNFTSNIDNPDNKPDIAVLSQNYPNPFNPSTAIDFYNNVQGNVKLSVLNAKGESVATLVNDKLSAGNFSAKFDAGNFNSGIYFYMLETPSATITKKMLLVK